jgi:putative transcriptional regulator
MDRRNKRPLGQRLVAEFSEFRDLLRAGKPLEKRYTVRTVGLDLKPKPFDAQAVRAIRASLGVSQAVFANLLGISVDLVGAWEQGNRVPSGPACRLLELIATDKNRWLKILEEGVSRKAS